MLRFGKSKSHRKPFRISMAIRPGKFAGRLQKNYLQKVTLRIQNLSEEHFGNRKTSRNLWGSSLKSVKNLASIVWQILLEERLLKSKMPKIKLDSAQQNPLARRFAFPAGAYSWFATPSSNFKCNHAENRENRLNGLHRWSTGSVQAPANFNAPFRRQFHARCVVCHSFHGSVPTRAISMPLVSYLLRSSSQVVTIKRRSLQIDGNHRTRNG